jgi:NAD(P)-dependent dehydrogenase (short-subunit alcohol dehydrogenase family)
MLAGHIVLVTGGTGPLGPGVLPVLIDEGATVITTAHRHGQDIPAAAHVEVVDVMHAPDVGPMIERIEAQQGRIDGLVCMVGSITGGTFIQADNQTWREIVDLSVNSAVMTIREVLPGMIERGYGRIVTVGARPPLDPSPTTSNAAAAQDSVVAMTRAFARELRGTGVTINCILTDAIDTPQHREALPRHDPDAWVKPEELARVIAFLCSDAAGVVRGATLPVG